MKKAIIHGMYLSTDLMKFYRYFLQWKYLEMIENLVRLYLRLILHVNTVD